MELADVKKKIKKLLALSHDNPSDAESYTALQKAQELMAKYKLEQIEVDIEEEKKDCVQVKTKLCYGTRSSDHYLNDLADVISENFCCVNYISTPRGSRSHYISFMGAEDDVEIACEVFYTANTAIIRGYNRVYKDIQKEYSIDYVPAKYFNPKKIGYIKGYIAGLKKALEDQKEQNQEWGLVLVVPQEAQDFMSGLESASFNTQPIRVDKSYYNQGYEDGSNFALSEKIDAPVNKEKLS